MILIELINHLEQQRGSRDSARLIRFIKRWRKNSESITLLQDSANRLFSENSALTDKEQTLWNQFESESVCRIDGMTMNERLFVFGLLDRSYRCSSKDQQLVLYAKVHAHP